MGEKINTLFQQWAKHNPSDSFATYSFARTLTYLYGEKEFGAPEFSETSDLFLPYSDDSTAAEEEFINHSHQLSISYFRSKIIEQMALQDTIKLIHHISKTNPDQPKIFAPFFEQSKNIFEANERLLQTLMNNHTGFCEAKGEDPILDLEYHHYNNYIPRTSFIDPKQLTDAIPMMKDRSVELGTIGQKNCDIKCGLVLRRISLYHAFAQHNENPNYMHLPQLDTIENHDDRHAFITNHLNTAIDTAGEERQTLTVLSEWILDIAHKIFPDHKDEIYAEPKPEPPMVAKPIEPLFSDNRYNPFDTLSIYYYTKRCLNQFKAGNYDDDELVSLATDTYGYDRYLSAATQQSMRLALALVDKRHDEHNKILNESLMIGKIAEHEVLIEITQFLSLLNASQHDENTQELILILKQESQSADEFINKLFIDDVAYCTAHKKQSRVTEQYSAHRKKSIPQQFLHKKFPEDAIEIQDLLLAKLDHIVGSNCDTMCHKILNYIAYYQTLTIHGHLDEHEKVKNTAILDSSLSFAIEQRHHSTHELKNMIQYIGDNLIARKIDAFNLTHRPKL